MRNYIGLVFLAIVMIIQYFDKEDKLFFVQYALLIILFLYCIYIYFKDKKSENK